MDCETKVVDGVTVVAINGDIVFNNLTGIRETIKTEVEKTESGKMLVDLSNVGIIDSAGVGFIVSVYKSILSKKGSFALVGPNDAVKNVLQTVGLTRLFKVYDDEAEALQALGG